jgi:hypothetical protein
MKNPKKDKLGKGAPSASSAEFSKLAKMNQKELGRTIGQGDPDRWDEENIERIIKIYEHSHPGVIDKIYNDVCTEIALSGMSKHGEVMAGVQKGFWLPGPLNEKDYSLQEWMERAYPSLWTNKKHSRWFMRHFPQFSFEYAAKRMKR